ncbi:MAG: hypothetical protein MMC23_004952 [Stictis urceolatum]|nr:hypothetical protein [Stictis urceolata]
MQSHPQGFNSGAFPDSDFAYQYCGGHGPSPTVDDDFYFDQDSQYPLVGAPLLAQNPPTSYPHSAIALNNQVHPGQLQTSMGLQNQRHPRPRTPLAEERSTSSYSHDSSSFESFENFATTCSRPHSRSSTMSSVPYILACRWTNKPGASSSECGETFDSANDLHSHIMDKHVGLMGGRGRFKAEKEPMICRWKGCRAATEQKRWTALQHVKDHMVCHSGVRETCDRCGKQLRDKKSLKAHKVLCGNDDAHMKYPCPECGAELKSASTLKQHMNQHSGKKFKCDLCDHETTDQSNLRKHRKIHDKTEKGRYQCSCHGKYFRNNFNKKRHEDNYYSKNPKDRENDDAGDNSGASTPVATPVDRPIF